MLLGEIVHDLLARHGRDADFRHGDPARDVRESTDATAASLARSEAFAQKYGFRDFADYAEARRRVMLAKLAWMKRELGKSSGSRPPKP